MYELDLVGSSLFGAYISNNINGHRYAVGGYAFKLEGNLAVDRFALMLLQTSFFKSLTFFTEEMPD